VRSLYSFCEPTMAGPLAKWCIRPLRGRKMLGGGINTPSLCGRVQPHLGGWDLNVDISDTLMSRKDARTGGGYVVCQSCAELYRAVTKVVSHP
jgi:hypothetical protein